MSNAQVKFAPKTGVYWFDFATWTLKQGDKYKDSTTNHAVYQAAEKEYKAYLKLQKKISKLLEDNSVHEIPTILKMDETKVFQIVHEIYKEGGFHTPEDLEVEGVGDGFGIYFKNVAGEYIDAEGNFLWFETELEAEKYIKEIGNV